MPVHQLPGVTLVVAVVVQFTLTLSSIVKPQNVAVSRAHPCLLFFIAFHLLSPPFPFWQLSEISAMPCSFVVDAHSLFTFSPHSQYSTNAVVGCSYTYSMFSFHNSS